MKQYLKMADVFFKRVFPDSLSVSNESVSVYRDDGVSPHEYAAHAINSHDELVQQNEDMKLRINQLLSERNATGVAIDNAICGHLPEQHPMMNRLQMIANVVAQRNVLLAARMDDREISDLVNRVRDVVVTTPHGAQCLRERISGVITNALKGVSA